MAHAGILSTVFIRKNLIANLKAQEKQAAIQEMIARLNDSGAVEPDQSPSVMKAILKREEMGSTGIGRGIAVPHAKTSAVKKVVGVLAVSPAGIDFDALDGQPVQAIFLVLSPPDAPEEHIQVLRRITEMMRDEDLSRFLRSTKDEKSLVELLVEADEKLAAMRR